MKLAQVVVVEQDGSLANLLRPIAEEKRWRLRELRNFSTVLPILQSGAKVLVLRVGRNVVREMSLLEQVAWAYPEVSIIVVGRTHHPDLEALAWDLGAAQVLFPPSPYELLSDFVLACMSGPP